MSKRRASKKRALNRWAKGIGNLTAQTEMTLMKAKFVLAARVRDCRAWELSVLKKLAVQHQAGHRALKEFKVGIVKASADLNGAYQSAVSQFRA